MVLISNEEIRVATKIFKDLDERSLKRLFKVGNLYQLSLTRLISYTTPCKLACHLTQKLLQKHWSSISGSPPKSSKNLHCNSGSNEEILLYLLCSSDNVNPVPGWIIEQNFADTSFELSSAHLQAQFDFSILYVEDNIAVMSIAWIYFYLVLAL